MAYLPDRVGRLGHKNARAALGRPRPMREALALTTVVAMSREEAVVVLGCQVGTVKSIVRRARDRPVRSLGFAHDAVGDDARMLSALAVPGKADA